MGRGVRGAAGGIGAIRQGLLRDDARYSPIAFRILTLPLRPHNVDVNMLLPGGATATGMIPDDVPSAMRDRLLSPDVMAEPILYLCAHASDGLTGERLVATEFAAWLRAREQR